jgi:phosphoribosylpyrophosphate synthetase
MLFFTKLFFPHFEIIRPGPEKPKQEGKTIVLVGDIIDKGYGIADVINLIYKNIDKIKMVLGNHENFVYKYLKGLIDEKTAPSEEVINEYFNTIYILQEDESLKDM